MFYWKTYKRGGETYVVLFGIKNEFMYYHKTIYYCEERNNIATYCTQIQIIRDTIVTENKDQRDPRT